MLFPHMVVITTLAENWEVRANQLAQYEPSNPTARTLRTNAQELRASLASIEDDDGLVTVAEFARMHAVTPQSVRAWIRSGELDAVKGIGRGLLIRRNSNRKEN